MKEEIHKRLPNLLRRYRRTRGLTQRDVAKLLGLRTSSRISKWESGACLPSLANAFRLSVVYRVLADALFVDLLRSLRKDINEREKKLSGGKETVPRGSE